VSEEIELVAKSVGESVGGLVEASGLLGPVKQVAEYLTKRIYYRQLPTLARVATRAAEKIQRLGLPHASVDDPVVLRILEASAGAQDESMQERWANLIANTVRATSQRELRLQTLTVVRPHNRQRLSELVKGRVCEWHVRLRSV
jgi:hypothetical protein